MTRNVDLSVESIIGLVAFVVADVLAEHILPVPAAIAFGIGLGLVLGMVNGVARGVAARPVDRRDAGHAVDLPRASPSSSRGASR